MSLWLNEDELDHRTKDMNLPIRRVKYKAIIGPIAVGQRACIWPTDHPDSARVSNETWALTSIIQEILDPAGVFRTEHTIYYPENYSNGY